MDSFDAVSSASAALASMSSAMASMSAHMVQLAARHEGHSDAMDMDMGSTAMSMAGMVMTTAASAMATGMDMASGSSGTATAAAATATATGMSGMHMGGMGGANACKISMLWNWNTIDACFISDSWHVKSRGGFAGTCIGVFAWVLALELWKRMSREFDRYLVRDWSRKNVGAVTEQDASTRSDDEAISGKLTSRISIFRRNQTKFTPYLWQQAIRAALYTVEFGAGYLLMLMAMYYNGYVLITMWLGAFFGFLLFSSDTSSGDLSRASASCC